MIYVLSCVLLLFFAYMSFKAHYDIVDDRIIYDKQLPRSFENFRIFFIADVHRRRINEATLKTINLKIDIVLIGGDLTEKHVPLQRTLNNIQKLKQFNAPILFVWGNNDHEVPTNAFVKLLTKENIVILNDTYKNIAKNGDEISIFGLNYYENDYNRPQIYWGNAQEKYMILLTHKPSSFYQLTKKEKKKY